MVIDKWDRRFMDRAEQIAQWSKHPKHKVGAVIVDIYNHVISEGYNGPPRGVLDEGMTSAAYRLRTLHAEINAILHAQGRNMAGAKMYIWPYSPCATCAACIIQVGIMRVRFQTLKTLRSWRPSQAEAFKMFNEVGVNYALI